MTTLVSAAYVLAAMSLVAAMLSRVDHVVLARLGARPAPGEGILRMIGRRSPFHPSARLTDRTEALCLGPADVERVLGRKLLFAGGGALAGLLFLSAIGPAGLAAVVLISVAGFHLPDFALARTVERRRREHLTAVPELLDVLAVSVSAGLSPRLALDRAPEVVGGLLGDELRRARDEVALGSPWRDELRRTATRIRSTELRRLASNLERSERLGTPVGRRFQALAAEVRAERRARREERARRAPIQMLFPLVLLILPAFVVAAVVPAVISATSGLA